MKQRNDQIPGNRIIVRVDPAMEDFVPEFLSNTADDARVLREAIQRADCDAIARLGHSMKGACGFGFSYLGELGAFLESSACAGEWARINELADELDSYLERIEPVFDTA